VYQSRQIVLVDGAGSASGAARWSGVLLLFLALSLGACGDGGKPQLSEVPEPPDTTPTDTLVPPPDTLVPPPDTLVPPPDSGGPALPPHIPVHVGIPYGPWTLPSGLFAGAEFTGSYRPSGEPATLMADLEAARQADLRIVLNFTGNEQWLRDEHGFSLSKWKARVDRFRGMDISSYIADGTIIGHFILDEPSDKGNWNGQQVSLADIDVMARYSKEIWPTMATIIRAFPDYLSGYHYQYLDAVWAHYVARYGPVDAFITQSAQQAKAVGLGFVTGLNVLNGGNSESGIPGKRDGKFAMSASQIRAWGGRLLAEPSICGFFMWKYDDKYFSRPDIVAALTDLEQVAKSRPKKECRP
jgi:hypothetical protein